MPADDPSDHSPEGSVSLQLGAFSLVVAVALVLVLYLVRPAAISGNAVQAGLLNEASLPDVQPVSGTPADWIAAVCAPQLQQIAHADNSFDGFARVSLFPNRWFVLPGATSSAVCRPRYRGTSSLLLLVARYPYEAYMQFDLAINGFEWYCFANDRGGLDVIATQAEDSMQSNGWVVSPVLEPLRRFGFNIYGSPGQ